MSKTKTSELLKELMLDDFSDDDDGDGAQLSGYSEVGANRPADRSPAAPNGTEDAIVRRMTRQFVVDSDDSDGDVALSKGRRRSPRQAATDDRAQRDVAAAAGTTATTAAPRRDRLAALNLDGSSDDDGCEERGNVAAHCSTHTETAAKTDSMSTVESNRVALPPRADLPPAYLSAAELATTEALRGEALVAAIEGANARYCAAADGPRAVHPTASTNDEVDASSLQRTEEVDAQPAPQVDAVRSPSPLVLTGGTALPAGLGGGGGRAATQGIVAVAYHNHGDGDDDDASLTFHDDSTHSASKSLLRAVHPSGGGGHHTAIRELWLSPERGGASGSALLDSDLSFVEVASPPPAGHRSSGRQKATTTTAGSDVANESSRTFDFHTATTTMTASPERLVQQGHRRSSSSAKLHTVRPANSARGSLQRQQPPKGSPLPEAHKEHPLPHHRGPPVVIPAARPASLHPTKTAALKPVPQPKMPPGQHLPSSAAIGPKDEKRHHLPQRTVSAEGGRAGSGAASSYAALQTMYRRAVHRRQAVEDQRERLRAHSESVALQQCTFKPAITAKGMRHKGSTTSTDEKESTSERRLRLIHDAKGNRGDDAHSECTFAPRIEPMSEQLVQRVRSAAAAAAVNNSNNNTNGDVDGGDTAHTKPLTAAERLYLDSTRRAVELESNAEVALLALRGGKEPLKRRDEDIATHIATLHRHQQKREATLKRLVEENEQRMLGRRGGHDGTTISGDVLVDPDAVVQRLLHRAPSSSGVNSSSSSSRLDDRRPNVNAVSRELAARRRRSLVEKWFVCLTGGSGGLTAPQHLVRSEGPHPTGGSQEPPRSLLTSSKDMGLCVPQSVQHTNEFKSIVDAVSGGGDHVGRGGSDLDATTSISLDEFALRLLRYEQRYGPQPWACRSPEEAVATYKRQSYNARASSAHTVLSKPSEVHNRLHERQTLSTWSKTPGAGAAMLPPPNGILVHDGSLSSLRQHKLELHDARQTLGGQWQAARDAAPSSTCSSVSCGDGRSRSRHQHVDPGHQSITPLAAGLDGDVDVLAALEAALVERRSATSAARGGGTTAAREVEMSAERSAMSDDRSHHRRCDDAAGAALPSLRHADGSPHDDTVRALRLEEEAVPGAVGTRSPGRRALASVTNVGTASQHATTNAVLCEGSQSTVRPDSDLLLSCAELQALHARGGGTVGSVREQRALMERKKQQRLRELGRKLAASQLSV